MKTDKMTPQEFSRLRLKMGLKQVELANIIGVTMQAVYYWETGEREIPQYAAKLMRFFQKFPQVVSEF